MDTKFYWGAATAAYQCEGAATEDNKGASIWDTFTAQPLHIFANESGTIADDAYHKVKEDVAHIKQLGLNAYRFSIAWSRIYPQGYGEINMAGIDHYNMLIDELRREKIEPFVTLYHWDLPQGLEDKYGGWLSPKIEVDFTNFANTSFHYFGDRVKKWVTINEPWTIAYMGYGTGTHAPGRCSNRQVCPFGNSSTESYIVGHNLLNAHAAAAELYRTYYQPTQQGEIGIVLNLDWGQPLRKRFEDLCAAVRHNEFQLGWFADPIFFGRYPDRMLEVIGRNCTGGRLPEFSPAQQDRLIGSVDFLGLNHYSTRYYRAQLASDAVLPGTATKAGDLGTGWAHDQRTVSSKYDSHGQLIGPQAESDWLNTVPWGFFDVLVYVHNRYSIAYKAYRNYRDTSSTAISSGVGGAGSAVGDNTGSSDTTGINSEKTRRAREAERRLDSSASSSSVSSIRRGAVQAVEEAMSASRRLRSGDCEVMCNCDPPSQFAPPSYRNLQETELKPPVPPATTPERNSNTHTAAETVSTTAVTADHHHHKQRQPPLGQRPLSVEAIPIYVTENGCDAPGESSMPLEQALRDQFRIDYLSRYLGQLERAILAGVDIRGYFVWSLLDNFEWADGYAKRFGIIYVDFEDPNRTRYLKDSAHWYAKYIHTAQTSAQWPPASAALNTGGAPLSGLLGSSEGVYTSTYGTMRVDTGVSLIGSGLYSSAAVLCMLLLIAFVMRVGRK